ncbi:pickpocket protein 28 [Calliphora vicina]|uniref:pickpocket protein 28 n=1 Tax=Calliphora vicina TaxID=7373 RepID=UPI00325A5F2F
MVNEPKKKSLWQGIKQIYFEYCANTSIHGVQYLGEARPWKEKFFWLSVFIVSIYCCSNLIENIYNKWNETPVIVSFSEKSTPVWSIPFPAVTICSETKRVLKTEGLNFGEMLDMLKSTVQDKNAFKPNLNTTEELHEFLTLLHICRTETIDEGIPRIVSEPIDYFKMLSKMLPSFERHFFYCKWFSHFGECDELFTQTFTEEGICFTFNGLNNSDLYREDTYQYQRASLGGSAKYSISLNRTLSWSLEDGYAEDSSVRTYPARVLGAGTRAGLFVALQSFKQEVDYACRGPIQGFKVLLHSPNDVPLVSKQFVRIPMSKEVSIAVKPNMITTSAGISDYHPHRRQCFLNSERHLKFFKIYTQNNCELECLTNFTYSKCGCVKFSMPRTIDMPVCGEDKIHCYNRAEDDLLFKEFSEGLKNTDFNYRGETECNCMPACTSLVYNTEISQANFDLEDMLKAAGDTEFFEEFPGSQMTRLAIYFKENQFITSKRSELYGVTDFLANCGGIFGLFMGFSILSMVEMMYHFSLRLWSNMSRKM